MVDIFDPQFTTNLAHPTVLAWLLDDRADMSTPLAMEQPYHFIRFDQTSCATTRSLSEDAVYDNQCLATIRPWSRVTYNENNSIWAFVSGADEFDYHWDNEMGCLSIGTRGQMVRYVLRFASLKSFKLVAVMPFECSENIDCLTILRTVSSLAALIYPLEECFHPARTTWPNSNPPRADWFKLERLTANGTERP